MKLVVDSDFWYGLFVEGDAHHKECKKIFQKIIVKKTTLYCLRLVVYETATVLSRRIDQKTSLLFLKKFRFLPVTIVDIDEELEKMAWKIFEQQTKKGTSFIDCANLAAREKYHFDGILSFDRFYPRPILPPQT